MANTQVPDRKAEAEQSIQTPTMGEILQKEFLEPMGMSAYQLAQDIHVPVSSIQDILSGRKKINAEISRRLAKIFGVSDGYFFDMQCDIGRRRRDGKPIGTSSESEAIHPGGAEESKEKYGVADTALGNKGKKRTVDFDQYGHKTERGQHVDEYMHKMRDKDRI